MSASIMFEVEINRIRRVNKVHDLGKVASRTLQSEMIMVGHQAVDMEIGGKPLVGIPKDL